MSDMSPHVIALTRLIALTQPRTDTALGSVGPRHNGIPSTTRSAIGHHEGRPPASLKAPTDDSQPMTEIGYSAKGLRPGDGAIEPADEAPVGWGLFDGTCLMPTMVLRESALAHNLALFSGYARRAGVSLAPHGKTTLCREIIRRQLDAGAWAMTAATAWQARTMVAFGAHRVLIANEVVDRGSLSWIASTLDEQSPEILVWADSPQGVEILSDTMAGRARALPVLVELGIEGQRAGARDTATALAVARAIADSPYLRLAGVAAFEGVVPGTDRPERDANASRVMEWVREITQSLREQAAADGSREFVVTGGGSEFAVLAAESLGRPWDRGIPVRPVIRTGGYVTHDHDGIDRLSPFGSDRRSGLPRLRPAIELWAPVLSRPEPALAVVGLGRRDAPFDERPPRAVAVRDRMGVTMGREVDRYKYIRCYDQHMVVSCPPDDPLAVGDLVGFGVAHPCTALDKWRALPVVDDDYRVLAVYHTMF